MEGARSRRVLFYALILPAAFTISSLIFNKTSHALTASYGEPYHGNLVNGVVFPNMFPGYHVRDYNMAYTTPELAGALLDAIEAVRTQFPGTCNVFIGDFSKNGGGPHGGHVSHQNGRDVDVGLYAKDNRPLDNLIPMNRDNLDPAKTLFLIENLAASQRVQYIFLDRSIQKVLYDYGLSHGCKEPYLNRLFGNVPGSLVQDIPGHVTHMHIRFFTPWSTLAAHIGADEANMRSIIAVAQESYLPKKVDYYVTGNDRGISQLAKSFGVSERELCAWNRLTPYSVLVPGSCLVFYKRSFESGPVLLANSLQPGYIAQAATPPVKVASAERQSPSLEMSDAVEEAQVSNPAPVERVEPASAPSHPARTSRTARVESGNSAKPAAYYRVARGGTLKDIARKAGVSVSTLCRLNRLPANARLRPGSRILLAQAGDVPATRNITKGRHSSSAICFASESGKNGMTAAYYRVAHTGTLRDVAGKTGIPLSSLCRLNHLSRNSHLKRGQMIKLAQADLPVRPSFGRSSCAIKYPARKTSAVRHEKHSKKLLKSSGAGSVHKPVVSSRSTQHNQAASRHVAANHAKAASPKAVVSSRLKAHNHPARAERKQSAHSKMKAKPVANRSSSRSRLARR
jgi:LysM repeat protein/murein endopeptidase